MNTPDLATTTSRFRRNWLNMLFADWDRTQLSVSFIILGLIALAPLVVHVPLAALAAVLLVVCWHMAELRHWPHILRAGRSDAALLPLAFGLTAFIGLTMAILVGVVLAMFFFARRMGDHMQIERVGRDREPSGELPAGLPPGVEVYEVRGPFFFGAATMLRDLDDGLERGTRALVLRLRHVPFIDVTAAFALRELHASCARRGVRLVLAEVHSRPVVDVERLGLMMAGVPKEEALGGKKA